MKSLRTSMLLVAFALCVSVAGCRCRKEPDQAQAPARPAPVQSESRAEIRVDGPVSLAAFPAWMKACACSLKWRAGALQPKLTAETLRQSLRVGRQYLLNNQKPAGNFNYMYDFVARRLDTEDMAVRQAGVLWSVALLYQYEQTPECRAALDRGLTFWLDHTGATKAKGALAIAYPGDDHCGTGTVALVALTIIEYLRTEKAGKVKLDDAWRRRLTEALDGYLKHLRAMRLGDGHFSRGYMIRTRTRDWKSSPYFDGETLLCLVKAAKYLGYKDLIPIIEESALIMARAYTVDAWRAVPDSDLTKGFYQWSCMAFWEYQDAGWRNAETFRDYILTLAWWMIHVHGTLDRTGNTGYAYEGLTLACQIARSRGDEPAAQELARVIDEGLYTLTTWQVGGPLQRANPFLVAHPTDDPLAVGGVMRFNGRPGLRIDVAQHQMHAVVLALKYVYNAR